MYYLFAFPLLDINDNILLIFYYLFSRSQSSLSRGGQTEDPEDSHLTQLSKSDVVLTFQIEVTFIKHNSCM